MIDKKNDVFNINYSPWEDPELKAQATNGEGAYKQSAHKLLVDRQVAHLSLHLQLAKHGILHVSDEYLVQVESMDNAVAGYTQYQNENRSRP